MTDALGEAREMSERAVTIAQTALRSACAQIDYPSLPSIDFADVVQGLLARQFQLWTVGVLSPASTTAPVYPLIARALVDSTITLGWIVDNPDSAEQFKLYSAGRLKLLAEHWRAIDLGNQSPEAKKYADQLTEIVSSERMAEVLPVDIGDWNDRSVRQTAIDVGLKSLYDLWYSPLSADSHADWMSLRGHYVRLCDEEVHPQHWTPVFERPTRNVSAPSLFTDFFLESILRAEKGLGINVEGLDEVPSLVASAADRMLAAGGQEQGKPDDGDALTAEN